MMKMARMVWLISTMQKCGSILINPMKNGEHTIQLIQRNGIKMSLDEMMLKIEIADRLDQESYDVWDRARIIKNQDYHDGVVKGLKMAADLVRKL